MSSPGKTVLIVDDNEDILRSTAAFFRAHGYRVVESSTPLGVTALIQQHVPNVLVLDLMMPALNGDALLKLLRRSVASRGLPTVLYSSANEELLYELSKSVEGTDYVQKSDGLAVLLDAVQARIGDGPA